MVHSNKTGNKLQGLFWDMDNRSWVKNNSSADFKIFGFYIS